MAARSASPTPRRGSAATRRSFRWATAGGMTRAESRAHSRRGGRLSYFCNRTVMTRASSPLRATRDARAPGAIAGAEPAALIHSGDDRIVPLSRTMTIELLLAPLCRGLGDEAAVEG